MSSDRVFQQIGAEPTDEVFPYGECPMCEHFPVVPQIPGLPKMKHGDILMCCCCGELIEFEEDGITLAPASEEKKELLFSQNEELASHYDEMVEKLRSDENPIRMRKRVCEKIEAEFPVLPMDV